MFFYILLFGYKSSPELNKLNAFILFINPCLCGLPGKLI